MLLVRQVMVPSHGTQQTKDGALVAKTSRMLPDTLLLPEMLHARFTSKRVTELLKVLPLGTEDLSPETKKFSVKDGMTSDN